MNYCECCGARIVKYWHRLNKGLCGALVRVYSKARLNPIKISEVISHTQACNFQKLSYWGLVEKAEKEGYWKVTPLGQSFILKNISIPLRVQTFRGKAIDEDQERVEIKDVIEGYQWREDYLGSAE